MMDGALSDNSSDNNMVKRSKNLLSNEMGGS